MSIDILLDIVPADLVRSDSVDRQASASLHPTAGDPRYGDHEATSPRSDPWPRTAAIEWTEVTWNPVTGCDRVAAGCDNCYALALSKRLKAMGAEKYQNDGDPRTSGPGLRCHDPSGGARPALRWRSPKVVFVNSMSDLFHAKVPIELRPRRLRRHRARRRSTPTRCSPSERTGWRRVADRLDWPDNLWMGVSVESLDVRRPDRPLARHAGSGRFLSCEPLLTALPDSQPRRHRLGDRRRRVRAPARPMDADWALDIRDQCTDADVAFFFKQWGGRTPKANGRELEGRTWDAMPEPALA